MLIKWGVIHENVALESVKALLDAQNVYMPTRRACAPYGSAMGHWIFIVRALHSALFPFASKYSII